MPIYEYRCTRCRHTFDLYQAVGEPAPRCPECDATTTKVFASVGLIFKGSGFHTTDYRKTASGNGDDTNRDAASNRDAAAKRDTTAKRDREGAKASPPSSDASEGTSSSTSTGSAASDKA
jgi:putative FmdB family regulatory protein